MQKILTKVGQFKMIEERVLFRLDIKFLSKIFDLECKLTWNMFINFYWNILTFRRDNVVKI